MKINSLIAKSVKYINERDKGAIALGAGPLRVKVERVYNALQLMASRADSQAAHLAKEIERAWSEHLKTEAKCFDVRVDGHWFSPRIRYTDDGLPYLVVRAENVRRKRPRVQFDMGKVSPPFGFCGWQEQVDQRSGRIVAYVAHAKQF